MTAVITVVVAAFAAFVRSCKLASWLLFASVPPATHRLEDLVLASNRCLSSCLRKINPCRHTEDGIDLNLYSLP